MELALVHFQKYWLLSRFYTFKSFTDTRRGSKIEDDPSIMTYKGHSVFKTLIRCRFSPAHSTGQKFIYTGCGTGAIKSKFLNQN